MSVTACAAAAVAALFFGPAVADRWRPPELLVKDRAPATSAEEIRELALGYLGRPYVMGGVGSPAFDCSGFTCRVYAEAGYAIPRVSRDQARAGRDVALDALAPGDLLFFTGDPGGSRIAHVGIYLGDRELVHASTGDGKIVIASLAASWFRDRLVSARRVLPDPGDTRTSSTVALLARTSTTSRPTPPRTLELVEHTGDTMLPPMLRLPPRHARLSFGPELAGLGRTSFGVRSAFVTEAGILGLVLAPEAALRLDSIALEVAIAVPVRFEVDRDPTVGTIDSFGDATRFLRSAELGLRGAELELRLSRFGDASLLGGLVLDRLAPASRVAGVPGLTVARSPLSFFGAARFPELELEVFADDVVDPGILGASVLAPVVEELLFAGVGIATDQAGRYHGARRALTAAEVQLVLRALSERAWSFDVEGGASVLSALDGAGASVRAKVSLEHRFGGGARAIGGSLHGGWIGAHALGAMLGPTYAAHGEVLLEALDDTHARGLFGAEAHLRLGKLSLGLAYEDGAGGRPHAFDRAAALVLDADGLPLGGTRVGGARVAFASRGLFEDAAEYVLHAGARVRLASWLFAELYAELGERLEGGGGVTVSYAP